MTSVSAATQTATHELQPAPAPSTAPATIPPPCPTPEPAAAQDGPLKFATPQDLPSHPSLGLSQGDAALSAAASLGWASTKPPTPWAPASDSHAHRAATLAKDYKMPSTWQPSPASAGSKTAAVLAAENAARGDRQLSQASSSSAAALPANKWGSSAANQAFAAGRSLPRDSVSSATGMLNLDRQKSLRAARGAMAGSTRPRSTSTPMTYPDSANAAANALSAATIAHRHPGPATAHGPDAGASPITRLDRQMYTSNPPVKPEVDQRNREAVLHASALAMAKKMYTSQQKALEAAISANEQWGSRPGSADSHQVRPMHFNNLQEAAYRLAQERLAKLHDEHQRNRGYQDYYGAGTSPASPARRLTKLGKTHRRSSSDSDLAGPGTENDKKRSRQIQRQMSLFSTRLSEVDQAQRLRDREALLAAAQRNVRAAMEGMDEKVSHDTGRVTSAKLSEWELKAHATAKARSYERKGDANATGKVDLGGGQHMDRDRVEEIAAKRVQPLLDEINEKAEAERKRIVALREEQEKRRLEWEAEKARNAEAKEAQRKLRDEEKARRGELKQEAKARKEEEKAARAEEKRLAREENEKRKPPAVATAPGEREVEDVSGEAERRTEDNTVFRHRILPFTPRIQTKSSTTANKAKSEPSPLSPSSNTSPESANGSPTSRVRNWIKSRLHKPRAKSMSGNNAGSGGKSSDGGGGKASGGFLGGHRLRRLHPDGTGSMTSLGEEGNASMREVALAGRASTPLAISGEPAKGTSSKGAAPAPPANRTGVHGRVGGSARSDGDGERDDGGSVQGRTARSGGVAPEPEDIAPPPTLLDPGAAGTGVASRTSVGSGGGGNRDSKFIENID